MKATITLVAAAVATFGCASAFLVGTPVNAPRAQMCSSTTRMAVTLPPLPYEYTALEPHISKSTLEFHHDKHHAKYVATTNELIKGGPLESASLEDIVKAAIGKNQTLFNNAGQFYNHNVYWNSITPNGGGAPTGALADLINRDFGSYANFSTQFAKAANTNFGSGWTWLVQDGDGKLKIVSTSNADTPLTDGLKVLLTWDTWEHAYYLDYQNLRQNYTAVFLEKLANWDYANKLL